jgi:hypothetical protein
MKRSTIQCTLKYGMGIFISALAIAASLLNSHHAQAAQGAPKLGDDCLSYTGAIITSKTDGQVLTARKNLSLTGAYADLEPANGSDNQKWKFVPTNVSAGSCVYKITSLQFGDALTAEDYTLGTNSGVALSEDSAGLDTQLWRIVLAPSAYAHIGFGYTENYRNIYKIVSLKNGKELDVFARSFLEGAPVILADNDDHCGHAQSWYIGPELGNSSPLQGQLKPAFPGQTIFVCHR